MTQFHPAALPRILRTHFARRPWIELYDLTKDPLDSINVVDRPAYAQAKRTIMKRLWTWMQETNDPLPNGLPLPPMHHKTLALLKEAAAK